jgi:hypothetical protein
MGEGSRLLAHQDRGPLADVMIDVVLQRKLAVDRYVPGKVSDYLRRGGTSGLDALDVFSHGVGESLAKTSSRIDAVLSELHDQTRSVAHTTLSEAIEWRWQAQKSLKLSHLTNSDVTIQHDDSRLQLMPMLQRAMEDIEVAAWRHRSRPEHMKALDLFQEGHTAAMQVATQRDALAGAVTQLASHSAAHASLKDKRDKAAGDLASMRAGHAARSNAGLVSRLRYRLGDQSSEEAKIVAKA